MIVNFFTVTTGNDGKVLYLTTSTLPSLLAKLIKFLNKKISLHRPRFDTGTSCVWIQCSIIYATKSYTCCSVTFEPYIPGRLWSKFFFMFSTTSRQCDKIKYKLRFVRVSYALVWMCALVYNPRVNVFMYAHSNVCSNDSLTKYYFTHYQGKIMWTSVTESLLMVTREVH